MSRTLRLFATLAMLALIVAGCSNAPASTGSGGNAFVAAQAATPTSVPAGTGSSDGNNVAAARTAVTPTATVFSTGNGNGNTATGATREQAVKFAQCMRANGVSQFPDPGPSGNLTIDQIANGSSLDTNSAAFKKAISACKGLEPAGFTGSKRSPEQQKAALKFAQCIRDNGVKDFPDPDPNGPLVDTNRIPSANRPGGVSILNAAMKKCGDLARNAGVTGGR